MTRTAKRTLVLAGLVFAVAACAMLERDASEVAPKWTRTATRYEIATCPARYSVYVDEDEAMRGEDAAHCVLDAGRDAGRGRP